MNTSAATFLLGVSLLALLIVPVIKGPALAQNGKTIFGENKKETTKAMGKIAKALGVKCLHCHVKEGGKTKFEIDTPNKAIARQMKHGFVDSLVKKGRVELKLVEEKHEIQIVAEYKADGENAGIHLMAKKEEKSFNKVVGLPKKGEEISCITCHNKKLHILTEAK